MVPFPMLAAECDAMLATAMNVGQVLEAGMLVCFGISWPVDILRTWRVRRTEGKSLAFMFLVLVGYTLGLGSKLVRAARTGEPLEGVSTLYVLNALFIIVDIVLTMRIRARQPV
jgi:hypothetical protein